MEGGHIKGATSFSVPLGCLGGQGLCLYQGNHMDLSLSTVPFSLPKAEERESRCGDSVPHQLGGAPKFERHSASKRKPL